MWAKVNSKLERSSGSYPIHHLLLLVERPDRFGLVFQSLINPSTYFCLLFSQTTQLVTASFQWASLPLSFVSISCIEDGFSTPCQAFACLDELIYQKVFLQKHDFLFLFFLFPFFGNRHSDSLDLPD